MIDPQFLEKPPVPDDVETLGPMIMESDYDNVHRAIARRSMIKAEAIERNPSLYDVVDKVVKGFVLFCREHNLEPEEVEVIGRMTPDGRIMIAIDRLDRV